MNEWSRHTDDLLEGVVADENEIDRGQSGAIYYSLSAEGIAVEGSARKRQEEVLYQPVLQEKLP